jgi:hypothetical protein
MNNAMETMQKRAQDVALLKQRKEDLEEQVTTINKVISELSEGLFKEFVDSNTVSLRVSGHLFTDGQERIIKPDPKFKGTVKDEAAFFKFLRDSGNGSVIKETVHHTATEKIIKEFKEANKALPPEEVLQIFTVEAVKITRAPKGKTKETSNE